MRKKPQNRGGCFCETREGGVLQDVQEFKKDLKKTVKKTVDG